MPFTGIRTGQAPRRAARLGAAALAGLLLCGCSTTVLRKKLERNLSRRLNTVLGPADHYRVRFLDTPDAELVRGRARAVDVEGSHIFVKSEFMLDRLHLRLDDVRYEGTEPYFVSVRRSNLEVEFTQQALNEYLRKREAKYDPDIQLEADRVRVRMAYPFLGKATPLSAAGHFEIEEGRRLLFRAEEASVPFITQPEFARQFVEQRLNPLLDLGKLEFPARLESVQVLPGRLRAEGSAALPREPKD